MTTRLLRLTKVCPICRAPPRLRTLPSAAALFEFEDPDRVVLTYQCHIRDCSTIYEIRVKDFQEAA